MQAGDQRELSVAPSHLGLLRSDPSLAPKFDAAYGNGAAAAVLRAEYQAPRIPHQAAAQKPRTRATVSMVYSAESRPAGAVHQQPPLSIEARSMLAQLSGLFREFDTNNSGHLAVDEMASPPLGRLGC